MPHLPCVWAFCPMHSLQNCQLWFSGMNLFKQITVIESCLICKPICYYFARKISLTTGEKSCFFLKVGGWGGGGGGGSFLVGLSAPSFSVLESFIRLDNCTRLLIDCKWTTSEMATCLKVMSRGIKCWVPHYWCKYTYRTLQSWLCITSTCYTVSLQLIKSNKLIQMKLKLGELVL